MFANRIYADFQNLDDENRVRLTTAGTNRDLATLGPLVAGAVLGLYTDDADDEGNSDPLLADGVVEVGSDTAWVVRVDWTTLRHASRELALLKQRFFDTAIGDMLRALDGGALIGATTLGLCVLDHLGFLRSGEGTPSDFEAVVQSYLQSLHPGYDAKWLWEVRNGLVHVHGRSRSMQGGKQPYDVVFTHLHPELHLIRSDDHVCLNVDSFIADVIAAAWQAFDDLRKTPEKPLDAFQHLLIVYQSNAAADKLYGDMHRRLAQLDWVPLQREWLAADIRKGLQERRSAPTDLLSA